MSQVVANSCETSDNIPSSIIQPCNGKDNYFSESDTLNLIVQEFQKLQTTDQHHFLDELLLK